ncbi:MAG: 3-isopropylmalate dehydratase large subunit [Chitinivibrionales bacterium]|nr:3-isopropylmalate dehydratase large subunit [Chitinivibrionales bacterium]
MGKTCVEKIFDAHVHDKPFPGVQVLRLDRVFGHEVTTPVAIMDLISRNKDRVFDPMRIKAVIDHITPSKDSTSAQQAKILRDWARRHAIAGFFDIGSNGVCHALFPEQGFIRPGYTIIMGDSHTCTHGAFGAFAAGVGTTDLEVGILKGVCAFKQPSTIRINCTGNLGSRVYAKDLVLSVVKMLGVNGATDRVIEFGGQAIETMDMESRMTICNMAIEAGATCGICMPDMTTVDYLWPHIHTEFNGDKQKACATFQQWCSDSDAQYETVYTIDASAMEPVTTIGYKPDQVHPLKELTALAIDQVYIGSCTNGRISDLRVAAAIIKGTTLSPRVRGILSPATPMVYKTALREGLLDIFIDAGYCITNPTCGACLGMSNGVLAPGEVCASTTNRNFFGRMGKGGMVHLMSPASAAASGITGRLTDPRTL